MPNYEAMYQILFKAQNEAIEILQKAQKEAEELYISEHKPTIRVLDIIRNDEKKHDA